MSSLCVNCSTDFSLRRISPLIVNGKVSYDNETFIASKVNIPQGTSAPLGHRKRNTVGMIFNNKSYKVTSSQHANKKKQEKFDNAETSTSNNNVESNIPLASFNIFNKSKSLYNVNKSGSSLNNTTYGKNFSQERYLMKKKKNNFVCENSLFIC